MKHTSPPRSILTQKVELESRIKPLRAGGSPSVI